MSIIKDVGGAVSSFLPSPWFLLAGVTLVVGAYFYGHSNGVDAGILKTQDKLNTMQDAYNKRVVAQNDKIVSLENQSRDDADKIAELKEQKATTRTKIITKYVNSNPTGNKTCGLSMSAATAVNELMSAN